jgi:uncharacterized protein (TIGR03437 family)
MYLATATVGEWFTSNAVLKLDPTGQKIIYRTLIGGAPESLAVDAAGNAYVAGTAGAGLGSTDGAYQPQLAPGNCAAGNGQQPCPDAFVLKLSPSGALVWATYLGGSGRDDAHAVAVDSTGSPWVVGETLSPDFPVTPNATQSKFHGVVIFGLETWGDGFAAKLDPTGGKLLYSTYLGGSAPDGAFAVAVDAANAVYITGGTGSTDFPTTPGSLQPAFSGTSENTGINGNAFVTKFDSTSGLVYSTYLGGFGSLGTTVAVDTSGEAAVNVAPRAGSSNCSAAAVSVLNAAGSALTASSPVSGQYLAFDSVGALYTAGQTETLAFLTTPQSFQTHYGGGGSDDYAGKVDFTQPIGLTLSAVVNSASMRAGGVLPFLTGEVAPGELVTLFGNGFGPQTVVNFDGFTAPVLYASNCQINAVVPFGVAPEKTTSVSAQSGSSLAGPVQLPVVAAAPALFTVAGTQAAVLNQDGTINSVSNPAPRGTVVAIYMTGVGALTPALADGSTGPLSPPFPAPVQNVSAVIGVTMASVLFAGQAPGLIAGVTQVNVLVPRNAATGAGIPLTIIAGGYKSQFTTLAVQ